VVRLVWTAIVLGGVLGLAPGNAHAQYGGRSPASVAAYRPAQYIQLQAQQAAFQQIALRQAALQQAALQQAVLQQAALQQADLEQAFYEQAALERATYQQAMLQQAALQRAARNSSALVLPDLGWQRPISPSSPAVGGGIYFKPPGIPVSVKFGSDGFSFEASSEIVTPIGTFGIEGGVSTKP
jgi:hypothetical protein